MRVIYNKYIPFKGFVAINLCGWIFVRKDIELTFVEENEMLYHENIHTQQMKRDGYVWFYCKYIYEYVRNLIKYKDSRQAYYNISYEREAYGNSPN